MRHWFFHHWARLLLAGVLVIAATAAAALQLAGGRMEHRLLILEPDAAARDPALARFAISAGRPLFAAHCAGCHGASLHGSRDRGVPDLTDAVWLYGDGSVYEIERTILYGIRSGTGKTRDVTDMPAFGQTGQLDDAQIRSLVAYVRRLSGLSADAQQAIEGRQLFARCADCHGSDARGNSDYGAPDLTRNVWNSGGDPDSLYKTLYFGQHHVMPAWRETLSLAQIRELAVYVHAVSHPPSTR